MATTRALDIRWIRRYRCFCVAGCVILIIQVFLAYIFLNINSENEKHSHELLSGRGKLNFEVLDDRVSVESSRRFRDRDNYVLLDDEEGGEESNAVFRRVKMPPDKAAQQGDKQPTKAKPAVNRTMAGAGAAVVPTLRLEELDFVPWCEVRGKEPVSAIHRAKTQHCKQLLANVTCLSQADLLYPHRLPHSCPSQGFEAGKSLGCFQDEKRLRLLSGYYANLSRSNSPQQCIDLCLQSGFPYAGVQFVSECFCGVEEPPSTSRLPDSSCNMKCPADPKEACGGYYTINVYQTGIAKLVPQPPAEARPLPDANSKVRILYLLTLNGRAVRQVRRLIRALYHPDHFFYIHVDARQDYMFRELLVLEQLSNVKLARERHATIWGGASLLTMLLESMRLLLNTYSHWNWDFLINLSESDFPIKTNQQLVEFLWANRERNFVKSHGREVQRFVQKQGLDKTFVECEAHMWRAGFRQLPWGVALDGGSDWVALSRPFVTFLAGWSRDPLLAGLVSVFKYTLLPAESFFHTALRNSALCATYTDNNLHVTNWKRRLGCKCQYKHVVDWCGCSPNNFKMDDWPRIQATEGRPLFFARKFEPIISQAAILQLEEWLYGSYPRNVTNVASYWQSVWHAADISPPFDDTVGTVAHSLARLATRTIANLDAQCAFTVTALLEVTSYMDNDYYKGSLIRYEVQSKSQGERKGMTLQLETWLRPDEHFALLSTVGPAFRIKLMAVSSELDQKEQTHRNQLRALSVFSEVSAAVHVSAAASGGGGGGGGAFNATLLWLDPVGALADLSTIYIEDDAPSLQFVKPVLKHPLLPGVWQLRLVWNATVIAHTDFLICPLQFTSGAPLLHHQTTFVHSGPGQTYRAVQTGAAAAADVAAGMAGGLGVAGGGGGVGGGKVSDVSALQRRAKLNAKRFGKDLLQWIDSLTSRFYRVVESCAASSNEEVQLCRPLTLEPCQATAWSALSPDPKSHLAIEARRSSSLKHLPLPKTLRTF